MGLADTYRALARYNTWMNRKLYALAGTLSEEERRRDMGAFFRSVVGTLNHLLAADRIWMARFTGGVADGSGLERIMYEDFAEMTRQRAATDAQIEAWAATLTDERLEESFGYSNLKGDKFSHPYWWAVSHFFNHQTHHRGQATTLFMQLGHDPGVTDLAIFLRD